MTNPLPKSQKQYELLYHPVIPGRGEFVRLMFEAAGVDYSDVANEDASNYKLVMSTCSAESTGDEHGNPPAFAPPILRINGVGKSGGPLLISQTPNIMLYLGSKLGLAGAAGDGLYHVNQIAFTALDLANEVHDSHHPISSLKYYEGGSKSADRTLPTTDMKPDQKDASLIRAADFRDNRLPKYLSYFERNLKWNESEGKGKFLVGSKLTYADTTLWQILEGLLFAFPNETAARRNDYPLLFDVFHPGLTAETWLQKYISSGRRLAFSNGLFRKYPELDRH